MAAPNSLHYPTPHNSEHLTHPHYRADIDGLRAIAILTVVGFHAFPFWIRGGFIGVDIFFVISGYLISTIIFSSLERNSFSFAEFYSRRIKRIFPALLLVLSACLAIGWFVLLADEYKQLGKHVAGGAGFISNFLLWTESGYFDNAAETKPLLHLWSLGVEEQYYIAWPLLLWLAWKKKFDLLTITIVVATISFSLNIFDVTNNAAAAFFLPHARFWELLAGSVLAYMAQHSQHKSPRFQSWMEPWLEKIAFSKTLETSGKELCNAKSMLGFLLIAAGVFVISKDKYFPGWWAVLPTLGAVLIISAGPQAWLNRIVLSNRVLVWFGLISFPLYLWHWPLLSLARIVESQTPSTEIRGAAVLVAIVLAWLTFWLVEKPIRFGNYGKAKTITLLILMAMLGSVGYYCYKHDGLSSRVEAQFQVKNDGDIGHDVFQQYMQEHFHLCTPMGIQKEAKAWSDPIRCFQSKQNEPIKIAIIGDSHAEHLFIGLAEELTNTNIVYYIRHGLPVTSNEQFENIFNYVVSDPKITTVILSAYWNLKLYQVPNPGAQLAETLRVLTLANKKVYITDDIPFFSYDPPRCKYSSRVGQERTCIEDKKLFYDAYHNYNPILESMAYYNPKVNLLKTAEYFCSANYCYMALNGKLLYRDRQHLNVNGSKYLARKIVENNPQIAD